MSINYLFSLLVTCSKCLLLSPHPGVHGWLAVFQAGRPRSGAVTQTWEYLRHVLLGPTAIPSWGFSLGCCGGWGVSIQRVSLISFVLPWVSSTLCMSPCLCRTQSPSPFLLETPRSLCPLPLPSSPDASIPPEGIPQSAGHSFYQTCS